MGVFLYILFLSKIDDATKSLEAIFFLFKSVFFLAIFSCGGRSSDRQFMNFPVSFISGGAVGVFLTPSRFSGGFRRSSPCCSLSLPLSRFSGEFDVGLTVVQGGCRLLSLSHTLSLSLSDLLSRRHPVSLYILRFRVFQAGSTVYRQCPIVVQGGRRRC